jgi:hypothetical protein
MAFTPPSPTAVVCSALVESIATTEGGYNEDHEFYGYRMLI